MPVDRQRFAAVAVGTLALLLAWDASGWDLTVAGWFGSGLGFPLRDHWFFSGVMHDAARRLSWLVVLALCAAVVWPVGPFAALPFLRRVQLPTTALLATGLVAMLKGLSATSCPWELSDFGGVAHHLSHWRGWFTPDGGSGHCFPAGHASSGFAFVGCYFALRHHRPRMARAGVWGALVLGAVLGLVQQVRGAHFMSHTLWTAWICWMVAWLTDPCFVPAAVPSALPE